MKVFLIHIRRRTGALALVFSLLFVMTAPLPVHAEEVSDTIPLIIIPEDSFTPPEDPEPAVTFDGLGDFYISPADLIAGEEQVSLADYFLYGVTALDENGASLPVELTDDGGFGFGGEPGGQFVLTYTARHPELGEVTGTRMAVLAESGPEAFAADDYVVTYDGNGNTGGDPPDATYPHFEGQLVPVHDNVGGLFKTGYVFAGWNTMPDGSGATYMPGTELVMGTADLTLFALWVEAAPPSDPDWERLRQAVNDYSAPAITIYPKSSNETEDLASGVLVLRDNEDFIDSDGNSITVARGVTLAAATKITLYTRNSADGRHFDLTANTLQNLTFAFQNVVIDGNGQAGGLSVNEKLTVTLENAVIQNCKTTKDGGGVHTAGNLTVNGGRIAGNTASGTGGGVYVSGGTLTTNSSAISGNTAGTSGGGVLLNNGTTFTMNGGEISENVLKYPGTGYGPGEYGGGVAVREGGTFIMEDGTISKNEAESGNGLYVYKGSFIMNGGSITEHTTGGSGGGLWLNASMFTMNGGEISGNTAGLYGGGVFVDSNFEAVSGFEMTGGTISGNTARNGGGVYVVGGTRFTTSVSTFTMSDGTISDNTAASGGGIYTADSSYSNVSTGGSATFFGNTAGVPHDYGLERGRGDYPGMNWSGGNSIFGTHLLNNYDVNYDQGEPPAPFLVLFLDWDGEVLSKEYIFPGSRADAPPDPVRSGYTFTGWDGDLGMLEEVASDLVFTATYQEDVIITPTEPQTYTVRYLPGLHGVFAAAAHSGLTAGAATPASPRAAGDSGWVFDGWSPERSATVTGSVDYVAQWERIVRNDGRDDGTSPRETTGPTSATERSTAAEQSAATERPEQSEGGAILGTAPSAPSALPGIETAPEPGIPSEESLALPTELGSGSETVIESPTQSGGGRTAELDVKTQTWALLNLAASIIGVLAAVLLVILACRKERRPEGAAMRRSDASSDGKWYRRVSGRWLAAVLALAALGVILFLFTEDMRRPLGFADRWTVLHAVLLAAEAAAIFFAKKAHGEEVREKS